MSSSAERDAGIVGKTPVTSGASRGYLVGWWMIVPAAALMVATLPGRTHGLGLVTKPLLADLGLASTTFATINLVATLLGGLACLPIGRAIDRFGIRPIAPLILIGLGLSVTGVAASRDAAPLSIAVTATRAFGQSMLSVASLTLVGKWFSRRLPRAMGIYSVAMGIGFMIAFPAVGGRIAAAGWRQSWYELGILLIVAAPIAWLVIRNGPRDRRPEFGHEAKESGESEAASGATFLAALATPAFWSVALGVSLYGASSSGLSLYQELLLAEQGFDAATYHRTLAAGAIVGVATNLIAGLLLTGSRLRLALTAALFVQAGALATFRQIDSMTELWVWVVAMGVSGGFLAVVFFSAWGHLFGAAHLGRIQGGAQALTVLFSAVGPLITSSCFDRWGSYGSATTLFAVAAFACGIAAAFVPIRSYRDALTAP